MPVLAISDSRKAPIERAEQLGDPVEDHVLGRHPSGDEGRQTDRRIDVTARDRPDAVGHGHDGETEGQRDAQLTDLVAGASTAAPHPNRTSTIVPTNSATSLRDITASPIAVDGRACGESCGQARRAARCAMSGHRTPVGEGVCSVTSCRWLGLHGRLRAGFRAEATRPRGRCSAAASGDPDLLRRPDRLPARQSGGQPQGGEASAAERQAALRPAPAGKALLVVWREGSSARRRG